MSKYEFRLPDIGEGVAEGEIVSWLVEVGDTVQEDQDVVEVMTDKATVTIGAPRAGRVVDRRGKPGDTVPVGEILVVFEAEGDSSTQDGLDEQGTPLASGGTSGDRERPNGATETAGAMGGPVGDIREDLPGVSPPAKPGAARVDPARVGSPESGGYYNDKPLAAPATRKLARELGVDLRRVPPSGKAGRVTPEDVRAEATAVRPARPAELGAAAGGTRPEPGTRTPVAERADEERIPIRGLRKRIYENMARSKHNAAHFHYVDECDVSELIALRERFQPFAEAAGQKLTFLPFIVKAVVTALKAHPALNCLVDDARMEMVRRRTFDIGIAVATEAGLIVPVLRRAEALSLLDIAREIARLAGEARSGGLASKDLGGSSFTITSLGKAGGLVAPPLLNYPEVGIMGVHAIRRRPVVKGDQVVVGDVMLLSWSFDHRIIDGHVGAAFAQEVIGLLQAPERLLLL